MTDATVGDIARITIALGKILQLHDGDPCQGCGQGQPCSTAAILTDEALIASTYSVMDLVREVNDERKRGQRPVLTVVENRAESTQERS